MARRRRRRGGDGAAARDNRAARGGEDDGAVDLREDSEEGEGFERVPEFDSENDWLSRNVKLGREEMSKENGKKLFIYLFICFRSIWEVIVFVFPSLGENELEKRIICKINLCRKCITIRFDIKIKFSFYVKEKKRK